MRCRIGGISAKPL